MEEAVRRGVTLLIPAESCTCAVAIGQILYGVNHITLYSISSLFATDVRTTVVLSKQTSEGTVTNV